MQMGGRTNYILASIVSEANKAPNSSTAAAACCCHCHCHYHYSHYCHCCCHRHCCCRRHYNHYYYYWLLPHPFNGHFLRTTSISWYQNGRIIPDFNKTSDDDWWGSCAISWTKCKSFALHSRQIITPPPHHSIFTGWLLFLPPNQQCQSTEGSKAPNSSWPLKNCEVDKCLLYLTAWL